MAKSVQNPNKKMLYVAMLKHNFFFYSSVWWGGGSSQKSSYVFSELSIMIFQILPYLAAGCICMFAHNSIRVSHSL